MGEKVTFLLDTEDTFHVGISSAAFKKNKEGQSVRLVFAGFHVSWIEHNLYAKVAWGRGRGGGKFFNAHVHSGIIPITEMEKQATDGYAQINNTCSVHTIQPFERKEIALLVSTQDEPWGHHAGWNKPVTKRQKLQGTTYTRDVEELES